MKITHFVIIVFTIFSFISSGCNTENKTDVTKILNGKWIFKTINGKEVIKEKTGNNIPYLDLNLTAFTVSGNTGCNDLDGKISIKKQK